MYDLCSCINKNLSTPFLPIQYDICVPTNIWFRAQFVFLLIINSYVAIARAESWCDVIWHAKWNGIVTRAA